ncbi:UrcA family protein [Novosphingobium sp. M1R2S20]|uniref:UrcA family protein n=1 Tax=Novosphingobium rhizovicinum TaxID=3228928 RepID=A0ABV3RIL4_9SPHN
MMMKFGLMAFAAAALVPVGVASATENPFAKDEAILELKGLDLTTPQGQQRLAVRMDRAARAVCGENLATIHLAAEANARECRAAVLANVRAKIEARSALASTSSRTQVALAN